ncbi:MAG TPA: putative toxin-antitoxin system toxin component, PIN family [Planktothrix sp. UBA8407]|jgi:putative toxin-antitoxin system toxin component, PIN family|nr:putative toxin-antitoxin system toxin component, PIN family [Planktothrix sp. UBA8407]HBK24049.1 putative toxin-antitoxin system toxin component, PIN family [Planktothrix sp. UBA10369]
MKVVIDTNVFVSGWLWGGVPARLLKLAKNQQIIICASEQILAELNKTLSQNKLKPRFRDLGLTVEELQQGTEELVEIYPISERSFPELRDPNDGIILATAIAAQADSIITGDRDLLTLENYENIPILTARDFLNIYFP